MFHVWSQSCLRTLIPSLCKGETVYVAEQQDKISSPSNNPKVRMGTSKEYHYLLKEGKCNTNIFYNYCVVYPYKQFRYYPNTFPLPKRR